MEVQWKVTVLLLLCRCSGRGLKMEVWNNSRPSSLNEIWSYNENATGYWWQWIDSVPSTFPTEFNYFTTRVTGFFVPPETTQYTSTVMTDVISTSATPAAQNTRYYMEILQQEYSGEAGINFALFLEESSFTENQTDDAVNEVQDITAKYNVFDEDQAPNLSQATFLLSQFNTFSWRCEGSCTGAPTLLQNAL